MCSGKVYYELAKKRAEMKKEKEVAIIRLEQVTPLHLASRTVVARSTTVLLGSGSLGNSHLPSPLEPLPSTVTLGRRYVHPWCSMKSAITLQIW